MLEVNLVAPFLLAKAFATKMLAAGSGWVINVASVTGVMRIADRSAYNPSKHGLIGLTRTFAAEWGVRGVRVNAVCPGGVKTENGNPGSGWRDLHRRGRPGTGPHGRFATPDDTVLAVALLADEKTSGYIKGHALAVGGAWTADGSWENLRLRHRQTRRET